jgi:hypothetical protein
MAPMVENPFASSGIFRLHFGKDVLHHDVIRVLLQG